MKKIRIVQAVVLLGIAVFLSSCGSGRQYQSYPPPPSRSSVSLIINGGPGLMVNRYNDGRYYYRSPQGYTYWRGYDNRYYLDQRHMQRSYHRNNQYNDWRRYNSRRRR